ncbi:hypothetical protein GCM10020000_24960 [Streptomyces olivoverticillatus]
MSLSVSAARAVDLRVEPVDEVLDCVERSLQMRFDRDTVVRKRRSVGARTDRSTWVRIERRGLDKIGVQGWNGTECADRLIGIAKPTWHGCVVWRDTDAAVMWRADETGVLPGTPVGTSVLAEDPQLPDEWWQAMNESLDALAAQHTRRIATPDTVTITQSLVTESIRTAFSCDFDTTVEQWVLSACGSELGQRDRSDVHPLRLGRLGERAARAGLRFTVGKLPCRPGSCRSRTGRAAP